MVRTDERRRRGRAPLSDRLSQALAHALGFSVESPIGTLGVVEAVRMSGRPRRPTALVVRVGVSDGKTVLVPVSSIENVIPETSRILLRPGILLRRSAEQTPDSSAFPPEDFIVHSTNPSTSRRNERSPAPPC